MKLSHRLTAAAIVVMIGAGMVLMPSQAKASEEGRRNTAIALGAAALALIVSSSNTHHRDRDCYVDYRYDDRYRRRYDDCRDSGTRVYYEVPRYRYEPTVYRYDRYDRDYRSDYRYSRYDRRDDCSDRYDRGRYYRR